MERDWIDVVSAVSSLFVALGGLSGFIGALIYVYQSRANKRAIEATATHTAAETEQTKVDTSKTIVDMWQTMVKHLEGRVSQLEIDLQKKDSDIAERDSKIAALETQVARIPELEKANLQKDTMIAGLQCEVDELRRKVAVLEAEKGKA